MEYQATGAIEALGPVPTRDIGPSEEARGWPDLRKAMTEIEEEYRGRPEASTSPPPAALDTRSRQVDKGFAFGRGASPS